MDKLRINPTAEVLRAGLDANMMIRLANAGLGNYHVDITHMKRKEYGGKSIWEAVVKISADYGSRVGYGDSDIPQDSIRNAMAEAIALFGVAPDEFLKSEGQDFIPDESLIATHDNALTGEQISKLNTWKSYLKITTEEQLDSYVAEWGAKVHRTKGLKTSDLNRNNLQSFFRWLKDNYYKGKGNE